MIATVYLIPTVLAPEATHSLPAYILEAVQNCTHLFVENERTARRYIKLLSKDLRIEAYQWHSIAEITNEVRTAFSNALNAAATIGIISEAGCPGIADPGQDLTAIAQQHGAVVKPLVGPNAILLALMASGMNGQNFHFVGYLPIDAAARAKTICQLENDSRQKNITYIFIETPYRNNALLEALIKKCQPHTRLCIGVGITAKEESIRTQTIAQWRKAAPDLHKRPTIFLLHA